MRIATTPLAAAFALAFAATGCASTPAPAPAPAAGAAPAYYGTLEPFASDAVYFLLTDRFVNGDASNDHRDQGKARGEAFFTFDRPVPGAPAGRHANVGYLGGDFKGVADHAAYIRDMGFGAVWITPIVDNPDEAFTGGEPVKWEGFWTDGGKTGYHGYWGVDFYQLDEHLPSPGLDFRGLANVLRAHGLKTVLDIVANHGSPAYTMPVDQPKFGEIRDRDGTLLADHMNLAPEKLDPQNPLHAFYNSKPGIAQLSDLNENDPRVLPYLLGAYEQWIDQYPFYVLFLDINADKIDVNVHPTKQEIKFEDERIIYNYLRVACRHALGKYSITPSLDFEQEVGINRSTGDAPARTSFHSGMSGMERDRHQEKENIRKWGALLESIEGFSIEKSEDVAYPSPPSATVFNNDTNDTILTDHVVPVQLWQRYIVVTGLANMLVVDQRAAHERILFESMNIKDKNGLLIIEWE